MASLEQSDRPWGSYQVISESNSYKVKTISVLPGKRLSYQRHQKRAEHWFITDGIGVVTVEGVDFDVKPGSTVDIKVKQLHRIANTGSEVLVFIEVQTGTYFGEDDIERVEDDYGR
jgi:mannose-6-phosphate isomerase